MSGLRPLYLGIDVGGTVAKAAAFDAHGAEVAVASRPIAAFHPQPGFTERDVHQMWDAVAQAVREVTASAPVATGEIAAVCCTGHGNGVYLLDRDGEPTCHGVVSSDTRSFHAANLQMAHPRARQFQDTLGQQLRCSTPLALFAWFDEHRPGVAERTAHAVLCKDYVRFRLTGSFESDTCDMSGSAALDLSTGQYAADVFDGLGLAHWLPRMPRICRSTEITGTVTAAAARDTGLKAGTPVVAGMMDFAATTVASGVLDASRFAVCAGTWSINLLVQPQPCRGRLPLMQALYLDGGGYIACEGSPTSATNLAWMLDSVLDGIALDYDAVNALVDGLPPEASALVYLPDIHGGAGAPRASFVGLGRECGKAHLLRAVYEGVVFAHKAHIETIASVTGRRPRTIRLSGGAARSAVWAQMFADVLDMEVEVARGSELGALGSAVCATVATGLYDGFADAVAAMTGVERCYAPDRSAVAVYADKDAAFRRVTAALNSVWPHL